MNLYLVSLPIGNLEDITLRALRILKESDVVFCEDTRLARKLFSHFEIKTSISSAHLRDEKNAAGRIIQALKKGEIVSIISDAGTPGVSDPGSYTIFLVKKELPELNVSSVPGPSALTASLSLSPYPIHDFLYLGFLPHKKGRNTLVNQIVESERPVFIFESPNRIVRLLESLREKGFLGHVAVFRELTKKFEEVKYGDVDSVLQYFEVDSEKLRGEVSVIVYPLKYVL